MNQIFLVNRYIAGPIAESYMQAHSEMEERFGEKGPLFYVGIGQNPISTVTFPHHCGCQWCQKNSLLIIDENGSLASRHKNGKKAFVIIEADILDKYDVPKTIVLPKNIPEFGCEGPDGSFEKFPKIKNSLLAFDHADDGGPGGRSITYQEFNETPASTNRFPEEGDVFEFCGNLYLIIEAYEDDMSYVRLLCLIIE